MARQDAATAKTAASIFQIGYTHSLTLTREMLLRQRGYEVFSVEGTHEAKRHLASCDDGRYRLIIIGHAASATERRELISWLRERFPKVKILALNPPHDGTTGADFDVLLNGPETWLRIVDRVTTAA